MANKSKEDLKKELNLNCDIFVADSDDYEAIKNFVKLNEDDKNKCVFCVVDLHAVTTKQDPKNLRNNIRETVATFLASGINPKKSIIFNCTEIIT